MTVQVAACAVRAAGWCRPARGASTLMATKPVLFRSNNAHDAILAPDFVLLDCPGAQGLLNQLLLPRHHDHINDLAIDRTIGEGEECPPCHGCERQWNESAGWAAW